MANLLTNIVARSTLLSALEEKRRHQMKKYLLHRLFFVALLREDANNIEVTAYHERLFQKIAKFHLGESASGVLLIYSHCILHILEASSGTLYHILMDLAAVERKGPNALIQDVKILVMSHNIPTRLFTQWYATTVEVPVTLEDVTQTQTTEEVITECLTLILKLGVYLATLKVGNKGLSDCLHTVVPELLIPAETIKYLCRSKECLSPAQFLAMYNNPLQPKMDSESVWPTPAHMTA
ncbi:testis-expressed protein 47 [Rhineura floridana]|uniref:testis-expressed protein 47 n=1 Tax=Rhineura floridana TaxID=261503 RepID=UPI002AC82569|nr:testis-expressed protein 47 [Rhineura floridana]